MFVELTDMKGNPVSVRADLVQCITKQKGGSYVAFSDFDGFCVRESYEEVVSLVGNALLVVEKIKHA